MNNEKNYKNDFDTILIAEDSPTQAKQLKHILEKYNYKVMMANNGKEALSLVKENKPSLIISDIVMPEMSGYELCKEMKADENTFDIPVILLTSLSRSEDVLEGISSGADNFITKPYNEDYLISHIKQILANKNILKNELVKVGVEIIIGGKKRFITASQQQMLTLLLSTYDAAVQRNHELVQTQDELNNLNEHLQELVIERTADLMEENVFRKKSEEKVLKLNRIYTVLSNINKAIVKVHDTDQLFKDVCMIAIDKGKFQSAWIGILNKQTKKIESFISAGLTNDYFNSVSNNLETENPFTGVIKSGNKCISNNISMDENLTGALKQKALFEGVESLGIFPLKVNGTVTGAFCISSDEKNYFDEQEIYLLDEIAADISFALEYIQKETERKLNENEQTLTARILGILNRSNDWSNLVKNILNEIKAYTGIEAIGIRMKEGCDFPYFDTNGFQDHFVELEKSLFAKDLKGNILYDEAGKPVLECMCGNIILGRINASLRFFTDGGSFWSNNTTELLASSSKEVPQTFTRNRCNSSGYESVALISLHSGDDIIGLLQLNDKSQNKFTKELIEFLEKIGSTIGIAFKRMQVEKQIKENEKKYKELFDNAPVGYHELDIYGRIIRVNRTELAMLGYTEEEMLGQFVWNFVRNEEVSQHSVLEKMNGISPPAKGRERVYCRKDQTIFPVLAEEIILRDETNNIIGIRTTIQDISERKLAEKELIEAKEHAEEMNHLKNCFLSNMSHELRTPLISVLGFAELLQQELKDSEHLEFVKNIMEGGQRLNNTLTAILEISRLEATEPFSKKQSCNLADEIKEIVKSFLPMAQSKGLFLKTELSDANLNAQIDSELFGKALFHLISNGIKFTNEGSILVTLNHEWKDDQDWAVTKVRDTGIGISKGNIYKIFNEFKQVSEGFERNYEGTGLGITIAKRIVELMKGFIEVESDIGKGSVFSIWLPAIPDKDLIHNQIEEKKSTTIIKLPTIIEKGLQKVLIVDDNSSNRLFMNHILRSYVRIIQAEDGISGVTIASKEHFDLILMDINLGAGIDGVETMHQIKKNPGYENVPIIAVTAYAMSGDKERFLSEGFDNYLAKPFTKVILVDLVERALAQEKT
jgi:PAS domain S-box-containing protein